MDDTSSLSAICCEYQFPQIFENLSSFPMKWWVLKKYIHWSSFEFCTDGVCWWLPFFNGYNFYSQDFLVGDVESGECFQIHEMSNWNPSGALWASIALCCVLQPILHNDSQSCCIFFSSLETCSPFLPMNHKLCLLQKPLHHFLPCTELLTPHLLYVLVWAKLQVSLPCTITCILRTLLHMLSSNLAANNDSIEYMAKHPNT